MVDYIDKDNAQNDVVLSRVFHALGDVHRRRMVALLRESGELRVGDLAAAFSMSLNGVSKHLKVLEAAEIVQRDIRGREHFVSVRWETLEAPYQWLDSHHHFWSSRLDALAAYVADKRRKSE
jgi:DNA-binding transcriptional ArsR family regulator